jgi:hypothetical protein
MELPSLSSNDTHGRQSPALTLGALREPSLSSTCLKTLMLFMLEWALPFLCYRMGIRIAAGVLGNDTKQLPSLFRLLLARKVWILLKAL